MARSDMRDFEWDFIEKLLPNKSRGVKRVDDRRVINGILYALRTGIPWRDMPEQYGPWSTIYNRFNRWSKAGIWDMIFEAIVLTRIRGFSQRRYRHGGFHFGSSPSYCREAEENRQTSLSGALSGRIRHENSCL